MDRTPELNIDWSPPCLQLCLPGTARADPNLYMKIRSANVPGSIDWRRKRSCRAARKSTNGMATENGSLGNSHETSAVPVFESGPEQPGEAANGLALVGGQMLKIAPLHARARVVQKAILMTHQEIPVERGKRAGGVSG